MQNKKATIEASVSELTGNLKAMQEKKKEKEGEIHSKGEEFTKIRSQIEKIRNDPATF